MASMTPRHRATNPLAWQLAGAHDPMALLLSLPWEVRTDPGFICEAVGVLALASNTTELAHCVGMSRMGLRKAMAPGANPTFMTMVRVADALGLKFELVAA